MANAFEMTPSESKKSLELEPEILKEAGEKQISALDSMVEKGEIKDQAAVQALRAVQEGTLRIISGQDKAE